MTIFILLNKINWLGHENKLFKVKNEGLLEACEINWSLIRKTEFRWPCRVKRQEKIEMMKLQFRVWVVLPHNHWSGKLMSSNEVRSAIGENQNYSKYVATYLRCKNLVLLCL